MAIDTVWGVDKIVSAAAETLPCSSRGVRIWSIV